MTPTRAPPPDRPVERSPPRAFVRLATAYWSSAERATAWRLTGAALLLGLFQVLVQLGLNGWIRRFFDSLERREGGAILVDMLLFAALMAALMAVSAWQIQARMALQVAWRAWLSGRLIDRWLADGHHYLMQFLPGETDNPDYRITEDVRVVTEAAVDFALGVFGSVLLLAGFFGVLWALSAPVSLAPLGLALSLPGALVWTALAYAAIGSGLAWRLGRPMIRINEARHEREGDFRFGLMRVRESSEPIAFLRGERSERDRLGARLARLVAAWRELIHAQRRLTLVTSGYAAAAPVVPLLAAAPDFLAGGITLGGLMQASAAFVQVQLALGFFVDNFARLADWRAGLNRVGRLAQHLDHLAAELAARDDAGIVRAPSADGALRLVGLHLDSPEGLVVIADATAVIRPGERILLAGESGAGKTTLFRAIAGLWPWGSGRIEAPAGARPVYVPQRPYFPLGTLRAALAYPEGETAFADEALLAALARCGLARFADRLDETARWEQVLADGEQQRLGFARLLIHRPDWVLMDEATSALDEAEQAEMMRLFLEALPGATLISAGLRAGLGQFHHRTLTLTRSTDGARLSRGLAAAAARRPGR